MRSLHNGLLSIIRKIGEFLMLLTYSQRFQFYMPTIIKEHVFGNIDFKQIANNPEFKEDRKGKIKIQRLKTLLLISCPY